jgi:16S rRNA (guanine(527)-N(7))-methyltransferase RsmG
MPNHNTKSLREKIDAIVGQHAASRGFEECSHLLESYVNYIEEWLQTHNVVSRKNTTIDIWENVYDSLVVCEAKNGDVFENFYLQKNIVDAGAGGGFPGVPLAVVFSDKNFTLVDISRKKCSFLRYVKAKLSINNIAVVEGEINGFESVDFIITKAAFSPPNIGILADCLATNGQLLIWASRNTCAEFEAELSKHATHFKAEHNYNLAQHAQRSLLLFAKAG